MKFSHFKPSHNIVRPTKTDLTLLKFTYGYGSGCLFSSKIFVPYNVEADNHKNDKIPITISG